MFQRITIGSLPDNVLLDIFESNQVSINEVGAKFQWDWKTLVHVCQRWRYLIFKSPTRLNLHIFFSEVSPMMEMLDVWPPFPFVIHFTYDFAWEEDDPDGSLDNLFVALAHRDRVREIHITSPMDFLWEEIITEFEKPFPKLRSLVFDSIGEEIPLPATFLDGSAPCLQDLTLRSFSLPSLSRLLSSASNLTSLHLDNIPDIGYIRPETMATCLSSSPKLDSLSIIFDSSAPHFNRPHQQSNRPISPQTWSVLPALTFLEFSGDTGYLEVLAARIHAPLLNQFKIKFLHRPAYFQLIDDMFPEPEHVFDIPQTIWFICHLKSFRPSTLTLNFDPPSGASLSFSSSTTSYSTSTHSGC
jgi:F-box-like